MSLAHVAPANESKAKTVFRVVSGNFLEMYDFMVYGYYASAIAKTYFPSGNEFASLMLAFSVFGAGFLMRPVGAIVLGAYIDHHGRRKGLILTLMAIGTAMRRARAGLCDHRRARTGHRAGWAAVARLLGGRRAGRRFGVSVRDRDQGEQGFSIARGSRAASRWRWCSRRSSVW